jgi:hypothetical protein
MAKGQSRFQLRESRDLESSEMIPTISIIVNGETREAVSGVHSYTTVWIRWVFAEAARRSSATYKFCCAPLGARQRSPQAIVTKLCISSAADKKSAADPKITLSVHNKC